MANATLSNLVPPVGGKMTVKIEVTADINVSAFVARQKANRFLVLQVGDQFVSGEPELVVGSRMVWRLPVRYAPSRRGVLGIVGHLVVDTESGEISIADEQTPENFLNTAEALYERAAPAPGT